MSEKVKRILSLYQQLDSLDRGYEMADVMGEMEKHRNEVAKVQQEIKQIHASLTPQEYRSVYECDPPVNL